MRYCLEYMPNPNSLNVNVDRKVSQVFTAFDPGDFPEEGRPQIVEDLFKIEGIAHVSLYAYQIWLQKGKVFDWSELLPAIKHAIHMNLDFEGDMHEKRPPIKHQRQRIPENRPVDYTGEFIEAEEE